MTTTTLRPNADGSPLTWDPTPGGTHYTTIDDDPDGPDDADYIESSVTSEEDQVGMTDSPGDYGSANTVELRVRGRSSADRGAVVELQKADGTVLATVTFVTGVDTVLSVKSSGAQAATLTKAEVDGLKIVHRVTT